MMSREGIVRRLRREKREEKADSKLELKKEEDATPRSKGGESYKILRWRSYSCASYGKAVTEIDFMGDTESLFHSANENPYGVNKGTDDKGSRKGPSIGSSILNLDAVLDERLVTQNAMIPVRLGGNHNSGVESVSRPDPVIMYTEAETVEEFSASKCSVATRKVRSDTKEKKQKEGGASEKCGKKKEMERPTDDASSSSSPLTGVEILQVQEEEYASSEEEPNIAEMRSNGKIFASTEEEEGSEDEEDKREEEKSNGELGRVRKVFYTDTSPKYAKIGKGKEKTRDRGSRPKRGKEEKAGVTRYP